MKRFLLLIIAILLSPFFVEAKDVSYVSCDSIKYRTGDEIKCDIYVDVDFVVTSLSGKIILDDNLELISSSYDSENWLMLDEEFSVGNINLISEEKVKRDKFVIASFVLKAINKDDVKSAKISFEDVLFGDDKYEEHDVEISDLELNLKYKSNNNIFIVSLFLILIIILFVVIKKGNISMKKNIQLFIFLALFLIPNYVDAANDLNIMCGKTNINKNEEVTCTLFVSNLNFIPTDVVGSVKVGKNLSITSSSYDKKVWMCLDANFSVKDINLMIQNVDHESEKKNITIATFKVKASGNASGNSTISFNNVVMGDNIYNGISLGSKTINIGFNSSESNLKSLLVDGEDIGFTSDKTSYSLNVDTDSITINATAIDSNAKVSGTGKKTLKYGDNTLNVVVTAEDGSKKTYTIKVNRKDDRNTNNYLKSLSLSDGKINFDKKVSSYDIEVDSSVSNVILSASIEDSTAKFVNGFGSRTVNLDYGKNVVLVKVISENEKERVYTLNIIRKDNRSSDTSLKDITISVGELDFKKDKLEYVVNVSNSVEAIEIKASSNDSKSKVEVNGPSVLDVGENLYIIRVTAENGSVKEYKINVIREQKVIVTDSNKLKDIIIKNHEFDFYSDIYEYTLKTNDSILDIVVVLNDSDSTYIINGNSDLKDGSIISIVVTDRDNNHNIYKINVENYREIDVLSVLFMVSFIFNILFILIIIYSLLKHQRRRKARQ